MFNRLNTIGKPVKSEKKLYAEGATEDIALDAIEDNFNDMNDGADISEEPEEIQDEQPDDSGDDDFNGDFGDDSFSFDDPTLDEDSSTTDDSYNDGNSEENLFDENEDTDSAQFKRKVRLLNRAFTELYEKYSAIVEKLKKKDVAGDRGVVVKKFIDEYTQLLTTLRDYLNNNDDEFVVRFQLFVEFRAAFIVINNKLNNVEKDTSILS